MEEDNEGYFGQSQPDKFTDTVHVTFVSLAHCVARWPLSPRLSCVDNVECPITRHLLTPMAQEHDVDALKAALVPDEVSPWPVVDLLADPAVPFLRRRSRPHPAALASSCRASHRFPDQRKPSPVTLHTN